MRLKIAKLAASPVPPLVAPPTFKNELLQDQDWTQDVKWLRDIYNDVAYLWESLKEPEQDELLFKRTEPKLRELVLSLLDVVPQVPWTPNVKKHMTNARHDFEISVMYAHSGDFASAVLYQSYSLVKIHTVLEDLTRAASQPTRNRFSSVHEKTAYGYDVCFTLDTPIPLLDGTTATIQELIGRPQFWVYSINEEGKLRPGMGHSAHVTLKKAPILAVELDNGQVVRCTYTHRFLLRNGEYCIAEKLTPGDSLMPLYRDRVPVAEGGNDYERTYQPGTDSWVFTHRFVEARCPKGYVRHHKDLNRFNNTPENLELMQWEKHTALHQSLGGSIVTERAKRARRETILKINAKKKGVPLTELHKQHIGEAQKNVSDSIKADRKDRGRKALVSWNTSDAGKKQSGQRQSKQWKALWETPEFRQVRSEAMKNVAKDAWNDPNFRERKIQNTRESNKNRWDNLEFREKGIRRLSKLNHRWHVGKPNLNCELCTQQPEVMVNHKVVSVTPAGFADVGDFSVEKYHNFALLAGVFVHNSGEIFEGSGEIANRENQTNINDTAEPQDHHETPPNPANLLHDADADAEFPQLEEFKNKRVSWPPRTR